MDKKYIYYRIYFNQESEDDKKILEYLNTYNPRDRNKVIKEALLNKSSNERSVQIKVIDKNIEKQPLNPLKIYEKYK